MTKFLIVFLSILIFTLSAAAQKESPKVGSVTIEKKQPVTDRFLSGSLIIFSEPPEVEIYINGRYQTSTTTTGYLNKPLQLKAGKYRLEAKKSDYISFKQQLEIKPGLATQINAKLLSQFGKLILTGSPVLSEAEVEVDGVKIDTKEVGADNSLIIKTTTGQHIVKVTLKDYIPFTTAVTVKEENAIDVKLERELASFKIKSFPEARVYIDSESKGIIPSSGELVVTGLLPGRKHVVIERQGYKSYETEFLIEAGENNFIEGKLLPIPTSTEFVDNFATGLQFWNAPQSWTVESGLLLVKGQGVGSPKDRWYCDAEILFGLKMVKNKRACWVLHAQDNDNFYLFCLSGNKSTDSFLTYVCQGGKIDFDKPATAPLPVISGLQEGQNYRIRVRIKEGVIYHWITPSSSGEELSLGVFKDPNNLFPCGNVGFTAVDSEEFQVQGFVISPAQK